MLIKRKSKYTAHADFKRLTTIWHGMIGRCHNRNQEAYKLYGAKGVRVCLEWRSKFDNFMEWALKNGYSKDLTIDRFPDRNGNYNPGNCRWATSKQQNNNKDNNAWIEYMGMKKTLQEWSEYLGLDRWIIANRINNLKWSVEDALTKPVKKIKSKSNELSGTPS